MSGVADPDVAPVSSVVASGVTPISVFGVAPMSGVADPDVAPVSSVAASGVIPVFGETSSGGAPVSGVADSDVAPVSIVVASGVTPVSGERFLLMLPPILAWLLLEWPLLLAWSLLVWSLILEWLLLTKTRPPWRYLKWPQSHPMRLCPVRTSTTRLDR